MQIVLQKTATKKERNCQGGDKMRRNIIDCFGLGFHVEDSTPYRIEIHPLYTDFFKFSKISHFILSIVRQNWHMGPLLLPIFLWQSVLLFS